MVDTITHSFAQAGQSDRTDTHRRAPVEPLAIGGERLVADSMKQANVGPGGIDMGRAPPQQHGIEPLDYPVRRSPADDVGSVHP